ncbi:MAG: hypothetical protein HY936_07230 [Nitrosomonadales bacterium]|nr:hypothetical protein [Nitrosomonadales bacterium]
MDNKSFFEDATHSSGLNRDLFMGALYPYGNNHQQCPVLSGQMAKKKGLFPLRNKPFLDMARPERFERPTPWFVGNFLSATY